MSLVLLECSTTLQTYIMARFRCHKKILPKILSILKSVSARTQKARKPEENTKEDKEAVKPHWQDGLPYHVVQNVLGDRAARSIFKQTPF
jgi:hypothetical protein